MSHLLSPTQSQDRIATLDILRGFAIFGILIVNMMWFNSPLPSLISDNSIWTSPTDQTTKFLIPVFVIFGLQIPFSIYWLKHFRFGPFEWLWRSLTYLKWQPLKR